MKRIVVALAMAGLLVGQGGVQAASILGPGKEKIVKHKANGTTKKEVKSANGDVKVKKHASYGGYEDFN